MRQIKQVTNIADLFVSVAPQRKKYARELQRLAQFVNKKTSADKRNSASHVQHDARVQTRIEGKDFCRNRQVVSPARPAACGL